MSALDAYFERLFTGQQVMAILRGYPPAQTVELASRAWDLGMTAVEVPVQSEDAYPAFFAATEAAHERGAVLGAGTIYRVEQVRRVHELGAAFAVAPGFDPAVARACAEVGLPYLPGVATATEIQAALAVGCTWLKAFPGRELGPAWIKAMLAPFPQVNFVVTGGVDAANAHGFLTAGARAVAVGSALEDPTQLDQLSSLVG
jgi:Entner-Doudoroff aldolase